MTKLAKRDRQRREVERVVAEMEEFQEPDNWKISRKGNLWREWNGVTLTVFQQGRFFRWSIASPEGVDYSPRSYETVEETAEELRMAVTTWLDE